MRTLKGEEQAQLRARLKVLSDDVKEKEARLKTSRSGSSRHC